jgi:hypothetical protein
MGRQMPYDEIPDSNVFPTGDYHVQGIKLEELFSANGKLMYSMDVQVMDNPATAAYANMHYFENFVIGSDDDLEANIPGTWVQSVGARFMKNVLKAAQIAEKADMDKICASFAGTQFIVGLKEYKEPDKARDGKDNPYAGQPRNKSTGFYKIGAREPKLELKKATPGVVPMQPVGAQPMTPAVAVQPVPAAPAPAVPAVPVVPAPAAPATATVAPAAPAVATPPAPPATVTPAPAGNVAMSLCTVCNQQVPSLEFATHINACMAAHAAGG